MRALRLSFASRARDLRKYSCGGCTGACACENGLEGARLADEPRASEAWADRLSILKAAQGGASCEGQTESPCIGGENILQLFTTMHAPPVNRTFARRVRARDSYAWTAEERIRRRGLASSTSTVFAYIESEDRLLILRTTRRLYVSSAML